MVTDLRRRSIDRPRRLRALFGSSLVLAGGVFVSSGAAHAQEAQVPAESPAADATAAADAVASDDALIDGTSVAGIDGTWTVDTEIGDFADYSSSWVGFRVAEVLQQIGENQAVGRTPLVAGDLIASGSTIESARIEADLTAIRSDQPRRDPAIQGALETIDFPTATFTSSGSVDLGAVPAEGEPFSVSIPGTITIHGVSQDVEVELTGQRVGDVVVVVGTLPVDLTSFGITMPTAPVVISVENTGDLEWQLFLRRDAAPAAEG